MGSRYSTIKADSGCEFAIHIQADGSMQVSGIHPYDETEYHWANKPYDDADWQIIRNGKRCACLPAAYSVLQVIEALLKADKAANLKPAKAIW